MVIVLIALAGMFLLSGKASPVPIAQQQSLPQAYSNKALGFSIHLPVDYTVDESFQSPAFGSDKNISGIKFTIPASMATGTNLSAETYLSVEEMPQTNQSALGCLPTPFLRGDDFLGTTTILALVDGGRTYSVASSSDAAAGNRYEEIVYTLHDTSASRRTCIAVRYFIHYSRIENYPAGAVREFDKTSLISQFDAIRRTMIVTP